MRTNLVLTGIVLGLIGGFFFGQVGSAALLRMVESRINLILSLCFLAFALAAVVFVVSDKFIRFLTGARNTQIVDWFNETISYATKVLPASSETRDVLREKAQEAFAIYISWRVRAALFGLLLGVTVVVVGSISTHVTLEQNKKLDQQNTLLQQQNDAVRMQILLAETERLGGNRAQAERHVVRLAEAAQAERRNERDRYEGNPEFVEYYPFLNDDIWEETRYVLTLLEPYPVFDSQALIDNTTDLGALGVHFLSRERGTILKALLNERVNLDHERALNFDFADMRGYQSSSPYTADGFIVSGCDVKVSSLTHFSLQNADFSGARINAVSMPSFSNVNVSSTAFYASSVSLPFASRLPLDGGRPGTVVLYDSVIHLPPADQSSDSMVSLNNIHILVEGEKEDGSNCAEIQFTYGPDGPIMPLLNFAGSTLTSLGIEGVSSSKRLDALDELVALLGDETEITVNFSEVSQVIVELLLSDQDDVRSAFESSLVAANPGTTVKVTSAEITDEQISHLKDVKPADVLGFFMQFE
ncbi:hypothetical protein [uncultured Tateyamaria sp.]|uniref:hypothetical protein n=1 Tax=uncultured Tateyamaria sp. TaxID=455651 RepID=UPI00261E7F83|nr:hypothetical protein [uncultured Tateyamaria sp.]